ncbi:NADAR family protein [Yinghuangia soli]|uniref:NADAR family protein n=1 Tax=Yinghuangia soli TaxID=2908204 RepID=A0AA41U4F5_9ACTN|nr:NADAR family protein [Yinghuangia soli]MCF2528989.1 NADAR family protein [Yinghuangia soli]
MIGRRITYRMADGRRIPGTWRHAFIRNGGTHFLTDLVVYADGLVDCWGLVTLDELAQQLRSGWVATDLPDGGKASAHGLAAWTFAEPRSWLTPELLLAEIRDDIDRLNGRPDATGRCLAAVRAFLADRTEENRAVAREGYLAIPETKRHYALGDMDSKDWPLRVLVAGPGGRVDGWPDDPDKTVSPEMYDSAVAYFEDRFRPAAERPSQLPEDGPPTPHAPAIHVSHTFPRERVDDPGTMGLRNNYPAPIEVDGVTYPTVAHAYWALSAAGPAARAGIAEAGFDVHTVAAAAARREGWEHVRTAVMAKLLRAKYARHADLAAILLATGDATLLYDDVGADYWGDNAGAGRNWIGRLLELVRSELRMQQYGI